LKGVNKELIEQKLEEIVDADEEYQACLNACKKYLKGKKIDSKTYQKLSNHLVSKGFSYDDVSHAVKESLKEIEDESWD